MWNDESSEIVCSGEPACVWNSIKSGTPKRVPVTTCTHATKKNFLSFWTKSAARVCIASRPSISSFCCRLAIIGIWRDTRLTPLRHKDRPFRLRSFYQWFVHDHYSIPDIYNYEYLHLPTSLSHTNTVSSNLKHGYYSLRGIKSPRTLSCYNTHNRFTPHRDRSDDKCRGSASLC